MPGVRGDEWLRPYEATGAITAVAVYSTRRAPTQLAT